MRTLRFVVRDGHLEPVMPIGLVEGTEVDVSLPDGCWTSTTATLLWLMERQPPIDPTIVDEFERVIEEGKIPVRYEGCFDDLIDEEDVKS